MYLRGLRRLDPSTVPMVSSALEERFMGHISMDEYFGSIPIETFIGLMYIVWCLQELG